MCCNCHGPINCYNDKRRYKTLVVLYTFDLLFFAARIGLVSYDLSKVRLDTIPYLILMLIFELIGSFPVILCNILYIILRHCLTSYVHDRPSLQRLWPVATMTCIRSRCHQDYPQAILLIRYLLLGCSFLLKFVCFLIAISCAVKFNSECTAYTVVAAFGLVLFSLIGNVEFLHFRRLSSYNPTERRNMDESNKVYLDNIGERKINTIHPRHLGFVPYSLFKDQHTQSFSHSKCEKGSNCQSESLYHYLLFHSLIVERDISPEIFGTKVERPFVAFYRTSVDDALTIAEKGFPYGTSDASKHQLRLKRSINFMLTCPDDLESLEAIICVRLNLGQIKKTPYDDNATLTQYFESDDEKCDSLYITKKKRLYVRMPGQIEKWLITINDNDKMKEKFDASYYEYCL